MKISLLNESMATKIPFMKIFIFFSFYTAIRAVSMGQGQEYHARKMMTECMATGMLEIMT